jgi:hypothetical protein
MLAVEVVQLMRILLVLLEQVAVELEEHIPVEQEMLELRIQVVVAVVVLVVHHLRPVGLAAPAS